MAKKKQPLKPSKIPDAAKITGMEKPADPEDPFVILEEDPDVIPDEELFEPPPYEVPDPGEAP